MPTNFDSQATGALPNMTGYLLNEARALLSKPEYRIQIRETVPPVTHKSKAKQIPMAFGEWRVLRQRILSQENTEGQSPILVELVVAREQIAVPDDKVEPDSP